MAVHGENDVGLAADGPDDDFRAVGHDEAAVGEDVGADRRDDEDASVRRDDGAARRKGVGGGAGGRGDDEAVGVELGEIDAVNGGVELDETGDSAAADDGFVEADAAGDDGSLAFEGDFEEGAAAQDVFAGTDGIDGLQSVGGADAGEEAKRAEVDAEERKEVFAEFVDDFQERAVAAQNEQEDAAFAEFGDGQSVRFPGQCGAFGFEQGCRSAGAQFLGQKP